MTLRTRLKTLEHNKPKASIADSNAKHRLMRHLQKIADRSSALTLPEQQAAQDWIASKWPEHLERIRSNAARKADLVNPAGVKA